MIDPQMQRMTLATIEMAKDTLYASPCWAVFIISPKEPPIDLFNAPPMSRLPPPPPLLTQLNSVLGTSLIISPQDEVFWQMALFVKAVLSTLNTLSTSLAGSGAPFSLPLS